MEPNPARRLWQAVEPLHAVVYFAPGPAAAAKALGQPSWWMGYFSGRVAPLGPVGAAAVTAMFYGFAPRMVARSLPDAWDYATPEAVLATRIDAVQTALVQALPPGADLERLAGLLERAVAGCDFAGRPLAAAWSGVAAPESAAGRVWLLATILREHRGDGYVIAAVHAGMSGLDAHLTQVATGAVDREIIQRARGWTDDEWENCRRALVDRGLLDEDSRPTEAGRALRQRIEDDTDRLATAPIKALGPEATEEAIHLATPLSRHIIDSGALPIPNPIGVLRP